MIIVALIPPQKKKLYKISNKQFYKTAKLYGTIYTLNEFQQAWNSDNIQTKDYYIRFLNVDSDSFRLSSD